MAVQGKVEGLTQPDQDQQPVQNQEYEEQQLINRCATNLDTGIQSPICENLSPVAKKQVQVEAQKLQEKIGNTTTEKISDKEDDIDEDEDYDYDNDKKKKK